MQAFAVVALLLLAAFGQDEPPTLEAVRAALAALPQDSGLDETQRAEAARRWQAAEAALLAAAAHRAQVETWLAEEADTRAVAEGAAPASSALALPAEPPESAALAALEEALAATQKVAADAEARLAEIDARQADRSRRKPDLATWLAEARAALEALRAAPAPASGAATGEATGSGIPAPEATAPPSAATSAALAAAQDAERRANAAELSARVTRLEAELAGFDARGAALERRAKAYAALKQDAARQRGALERRIQAAREREAAAAEAKARATAREVAGRHVALQALARANDALAQRRSALLDTARSLQQELTAAEADLAALTARAAATRSREELARGTHSIGAVLRRERQGLPDMRRLGQRLARHARALTELRLEQFDLQEQQRELRLPESRLALLMQEYPEAEPLGEDGRLLGLELLERQGALLGDSLADLERAIDLATELEVAESKLATEALAYKDFIDERVLWVRSTEPLWRLDLREFGQALAYFASPTRWAEVPAALATGMVERPGTAALFALAFGALALLRRRLRQRTATGDPALRSTSIAPTFGALARDVLAAAFLPLVIGVPAWVVLDAGDEASLPRALAAGALAVLPHIGSLALLRRIARTGGTAEAFFGWGPQNTKLLRAVVMWLGPLFVVPRAFAEVVHATGRQGFSDGLGRLAFLTATAVMALGLRAVLRDGALTAPLRYRDEESWMTTLRPLWRLGGIGGAIALFGLSSFGFDYTARQLAAPFERSLALFPIVLVVQSIGFRWLLLARRRILVEQARARRDAGEDAREVEELPDLATLGLELRRAVRSASAVVTLLGLYFVWREEIPALGALDRVRLYPFRAPEEGEFVFTASKLLIVALAVFATTAVARRLPGLLDFLLLDRTGFTAAERYAVRSVTQYAVVTLGVLVALAQVGITWSQLQWLAAAVSVGLGFGLQEIFANFVSGLILLFERPIRVGDLVTVNGMDGRVTNIRIRATTLLDVERRELIVPNRVFVTGSVVNWTLSDPVTRVMIPVGVAYGTDADLVHRVLAEAAAAAPRVLRDPAPHSVFRRFGDSALEFELRVFLGDRDHWLEVVNGLHADIARRFAAAGIGIPFPQREVRLVGGGPPTVETLGRADLTQ